MEVFASLELLRLEILSVRRNQEDSHTKVSSGFLQADSYFLQLNQDLFHIDENLESMSQTLMRETESLSLALNNFVINSEQVRVQEKKIFFRKSLRTVQLMQFLTSIPF